MKKTFTIRNITSAAILTALSIISTMVFKLIPMGDLVFLRFSLTPSLIMFASLALGPFYGAVVGVAADFIPAMVFPTGAYNFFITIVYGILGVLPWVFEKITRKFRASLKPPFAVFIAMGVILAGLAAVLFLTDFIGGQVFKGEYVLVTKFIILGIMVLVGVACCISVTLTNKRFERNVLEYVDIPSPNETALISLLCEVLAMTVLKSLAFFLFYFLFGNGYSPSFEYFFMMLFLGLPANVTISAISVYWMLVFDHKQLHLRLENKKDE
ncbi:MAG: ECF transporter S component [Bacilli bacterium]|nr:ECF transporter S component [Bacilli bacterium]